MLLVVRDSSGPLALLKSSSTNVPFPMWQWLVGAVLVVAFGSWLVWLSAYVQRMFIEEDIRAACERVMPETVQRCVDTVILQRGGARR